MIKNEHISSGGLARRCQARLTRARPFLPAAAAARDKLGASTPEVGGGGWGRRAAGSGSDSPELSGPSWSWQPGETSRKAPGVEAARSRAAQQVRQRPRPASLRAAPGGFSDAPQRWFCFGKRTGNRLQCLAQRFPSTLRHHCFNTKNSL